MKRGAGSKRKVTPPTGPGGGPEDAGQPHHQRHLNPFGPAEEHPCQSRPIHSPRVAYQQRRQHQPRRSQPGYLPAEVFAHRLRSHAPVHQHPLALPALGHDLDGVRAWGETGRQGDRRHGGGLVVEHDVGAACLVPGQPVGRPAIHRDVEESAVRSPPHRQRDGGPGEAQGGPVTAGACRERSRTTGVSPQRPHAPVAFIGRPGVERRVAASRRTVRQRGGPGRHRVVDRTGRVVLPHQREAPARVVGTGGGLEVLQDQRAGPRPFGARPLQRRDGTGRLSRLVGLAP